MALGSLGIVVAIALLAPLLAPQDPNFSNLSHAAQGPSAEHWLGTDAIGRDVFSRLVTATRVSLLGPLVVILVAIVTGCAIAVTSAWVGGRVDRVISRAIDVGFAFPGIILALMAVAIFGIGFWPGVIAMSLAFLPYIARILRGVSIRERTAPYVEACVVQGMSAPAICIKHIVPNLVPYIVAQGTVLFGYALIDLAALSFLGLWIKPPSADWGSMVQSGLQGALDSGTYHEIIPASLAIVLTVIAFSVVGDRFSSRARGEIG